MFHDPPTERNRIWQTDFSEFETAGGGIWRICAVIDYATKYCLAARITPTGRGVDALACLDEAEGVLGLNDLRDDRGELDLVDENTSEVIDVVPAPIAVVSDNGSCFRGETYQSAFAGDEPLLRHVRTRVRSPQTNGVIERFFGTLKYEHLYRAPIDDGGALAMETARFRDIYNRIRPHQALAGSLATPADPSAGAPAWANAGEWLRKTQGRNRYQDRYRAAYFSRCGPGPVPLVCAAATHSGVSGAGGSAEKTEV